MSQDMQQKLHNAKQLIINSTKGRNSDRVALVSNDRTWKVYNAGYTIKECLYDYDKMAEAMFKFHEDYNYDSYVDMGGRNKIRVTDCFGDVGYILDDSDNLNFIPIPMKDSNKQILSDLGEKGFTKYTYENLIPLFFGLNTKEEIAPKMKEAVKEYLYYGKDKGAVRTKMREEYGVPALTRGSKFYPLEHMFHSGVQGIKDMSISMRRHPKEFTECLDIMTEEWKEEVIPYLDNYVKNESDAFIFPLAIGNLVQTVMSPKQFEKWYHPNQKWVAEELDKRDLAAFVNIEGSMSHVIDCYKEYPDGVFLCMLETDKPADFKQWCPQLTILGGYPTSYLGSKTVDECVDKAKELLDTVARDGRWVYTEDKLLSYKNDVKPENLKAVTSYIRENGKL